MNTNRKKLQLTLLSLFVLSTLFIAACSQEKDPFVGTWENTGYYGTLKLEIKKDGKDYLVYHSHEPLQHEGHDHDHNHTTDEKVEPYKASLRDGSLHFKIEGKQREIKLSKDQKVLTVFERKYRKISPKE